MKTTDQVGLGFRREHLKAITLGEKVSVDFFEVAPENWMNIGGRLAKNFREFTEHYRFYTHGLSLSLGSPSPLDMDFVKQIKRFLDDHKIDVYSEHLSACSDDGHLYDLMPIPFTEDAVYWVAERIKQVMDCLERPFYVENVSYYAQIHQQMSELEFTQAILDEANCQLLLDVNNVYVNSVNHRYDAKAFIQGIDPDRIGYLHIAGHHQEAEDLIIDTHGAAVSDPVWQLLHAVYHHAGLKPTLLERDFNLPPLAELYKETDIIKSIQLSGGYHAAA